MYLSLGCCLFKGGGSVVVDLLFFTFKYFPLFVGVLCLSLFCFVMHYFVSILVL